MKPHLRNCKIAAWGVDPDAYHRQEARRGDPSYVMSPSSLKAFAACPDRWLRGYEPPESKAKDWGNLVDVLALTPKQFGLKYAVKPLTYPAPATHAKVKKGEIKAGDPLPWNANATFCELWEDEVRRDGRKPVSEADFDGATMAADRLLSNESIAAFLECSDRQVHVTGEWVSENGITVPVQCLIDLQPNKDSEFSNSLGDLKTGRSANPKIFRREVYKYGYDLQAAFDLDLFNAATGEERATWCFLVQENYRPYQPSRQLLSQRFREIGRGKYLKALKLYAACLGSRKWPGYDDTDESVQGWSILEPEPWMESEETFAPKFETETEDENDEMPEMETSDIIP